MMPSKRYVLNIVTTVICSSRCFAVLSIALLIGSCNSAAHKNMPLVKDSVLSLLPDKPIPLTDAETLRLYNGCREWYDHALKSSGFNGGILVAKNGNVVFEAYNGNAHLNRHDAIDSLTSFHIASVSKTFTAMSVLKLQQDGKLNIDDL